VNFISENCEHVLGYKTDEILSKGFSWLKLIHPDDIPKLQAEVKEFVGSDQTQWVQEYRLRNSDGQFRWFQEQGSLSANGHGSVRIQSVLVDIDHHTQTHDALKESEEHFRILAEQSPNMIFINQRGRVIYANEQCVKTMGYDRAEFYAPDFDFYVLVSPENHDTIRRNMQKHARGENVPPMEYTIVTKAGETIDVILSTRVIRYKGDLAILGTITDITERKLSERRILKYQQRLRSLASELSRSEDRQRRELAANLHDGTCQELALLKMQLQSTMVSMSGQHQESCKAICNGLTETMERLRDLSFDLSPTALYTSGLYAALEELIENQLQKQSDITWTVNCAEKKDDLPDDIRALLYVAVRELLINALKHARADAITVQCEHRDGVCCISVTDNGVGFDFAEIEPSQSGGFGLFNIQERLSYFGGELTIHSECRRGSSVSLTLPRDNSRLQPKQGEPE